MVSSLKLHRGFLRHVGRPSDGPLVGLLEQNSADASGDRCLIREYAGDFGSAFDLGGSTLDRVGSVELRALRREEAHLGEHVGLDLVDERGAGRRRGTLRLDRFGMFLSEGG
jgi:hypothetical protein